MSPVKTFGVAKNIKHCFHQSSPNSPHFIDTHTDEENRHNNYLSAGDGKTVLQPQSLRIGQAAPIGR